MGLNPGLHPLPTSTAATVSMLRYLRAFLRSDGFARCHDPLDSMWHGALDKPAAAAKLDMLVNVAVNRRGGLWALYGHPYVDPGHWDTLYRRVVVPQLRRVSDGAVVPPTRHSDGMAPLNHRGAPCRKYGSMYQTDLLRDKHALEDCHRRVRVYRFNLPEHNRRFTHLLTSREDD